MESESTSNTHVENKILCVSPGAERTIVFLTLVFVVAFLFKVINEFKMTEQYKLQSQAQLMQVTETGRLADATETLAQLAVLNAGRVRKLPKFDPGERGEPMRFQ